jgi:aminoglycoside phosphotransferase (APT) family kinase protein
VRALSIDGLIEDLLPDGVVGFLDWQVARRGNFSLDLGYFLQGAITTDDRRRHERALLEEYRNALAVPDAEMPSLDEIWLRYRASAAYEDLQTAAAIADLA